MASPDDDNGERSNGSTNDDEDLPTEVPSDSTLFDGEDGSEDGGDADERDADSGDGGISRRAALGGLGVAGVAGGGALVFSGVLGGSGDGDDADTDDSDGSGGSDGSDGSNSVNADPAVTFNNQSFQGGNVSVNATTPGEYTVLVTYGNDGDRILVGYTEVRNLENSSVSVNIENTGGVPGAHTAHLIEGHGAELTVGDALSAATINEVVDGDTAFISDEGRDAETDVTFSDQSFEDGAVSLDLTTPDDHFVILTYDRDGQAVVAGGDDVSNLDEATVSVDLVDRDGVPGEYTANVLANDDGSQFYVPGDALSEETANVVTASDAATVSEPDAAPEAAVSFEDQSASGGSLTLTATAPKAHFVLVTYRDGDDRFVAAADDVSGLNDETITVDLGDDGGVGGLHSAYIIADEDGSQVYETGDPVSRSTSGNVKVASTAIISE